MVNTTITNCHIHLFTIQHVPNGFLPLGLMHLLKLGYVRTPLIWAMRQTDFVYRDNRLVRAARFAKIGGEKSQTAVFEHIKEYYPSSTRFVVLPMDMAYMGRGKPQIDLMTQHDDLAKLAKETDGRVIPFCACDPRRVGMMDEVKRCVEDLGFRGIKLYPPLGFRPDNEILFEKLYEYCVQKDLPVMAHCSRGGVREAFMSDQMQARLTSPDAWRDVLKEYPDLRVCLAHFGGEQDWDAYLAPSHRRQRIKDDDNWLRKILEMMRSDEYPNLWTDISYTAFKFRQNVPALNVFLQSPRVSNRVLFGSDFFLTEIEGKSEKRVSIELRHGIGEDLFHKIAEVNPAAWLDGPVPKQATE